MTLALTTLLAAGDWIAVVAVIIGVIVWGISKLSKAGGGSTPNRPSGMAHGPISGGTTDIDELARRRREQLEMLARQRAGGGGGNQPSNLTMDQLRQRAQAKLEYERRAAALRTQGSSPAASAPPVISSAPRTPAARAPAARGPAYPPKAPLPRAARPAQRPQVRQPAPARPAARPLPPKPAARPAEPVEVLEEVHRNVADIEAAPSASAVPVQSAAAATGNVPQPTPKFMRQMMIWREILSPPVALRSEETQP